MAIYNSNRQTKNDFSVNPTLKENQENPRNLITKPKGSSGNAATTYFNKGEEL